jgi:hypothetical protein
MDQVASRKGMNKGKQGLCRDLAPARLCSQESPWFPFIFYYLIDRLFKQSITGRDAQDKNAFKRQKNPREASPAKSRKIRSKSLYFKSKLSTQVICFCTFTIW